MSYVATDKPIVDPSVLEYGRPLHIKSDVTVFVEVNEIEASLGGAECLRGGKVA